METRKVVVRVARKEKELTEKQKAKQERFEQRKAMRRANKKPNKADLLALEGRAFYTFALSKELFERWVKLDESKRPNERLTELLTKEVEK